MQESILIGGLGLIMAFVLILPFSVRWVEEELETFLLAMGCLAVTCSSTWSLPLIHEALTAPVKIAAAVLLFGLLFRWLRRHIRDHVSQIATRLGLRPFLFLVVVGLGLLSSVITAIIAALVLIEIISALRLDQHKEQSIVIIACYSIGLGAALTPIGEPLSSIVTSKLMGPPHEADFLFLARLLWPWVLGLVLGLGALAVRYAGPLVPSRDSLSQSSPEDLKTIFARAGKIYFFVAALVLLGNGFSPLVDRYLLRLPESALYWANMLSAVLDNATLAAAEVSPLMDLVKIKFLLIGLLISGGMLIPGNIPNIICAKQLGIKSLDWARFAAPLGLAMLAACFILLEIISR